MVARAKGRVVTWSGWFCGRGVRLPRLAGTHHCRRARRVGTWARRGRCALAVPRIQQRIGGQKM